MQITKMMCPSSKYSIKCPYAMDAIYITVHNTANDASAINEVKYMLSNNNSVSYHFAVDDTQVVQAIPLNRNAWHAGDGTNGTGNRKTISIEISYSKSGGDRFIKAEQNAAQLVASLLKERGWGIDKVYPHRNWSGKYCPHRTLDMGWQRFLAMIQTYLNPPKSQYSVKKASNGNWYYYKDNTIQTTFTGVAENSNGEWYIEKGKVNFSKNGLIYVKCVSYVGEKAKSYDGWYFFEGGKIKRFTSVEKNENGWWYVKDGKIDFTATTIAHNQNGWWYIKNGKVDFDYTGLAKNDNGIYYCEKGKINFNYTSVVKYEADWLVIQNSRYNDKFNGLANNNNGVWYCKNGKVDFGKTEVVYSDGDYHGWYYVKDGKLQTGKATVQKNVNGSWRIGADGKVDFDFNGIANSESGDWYCKNGKVDTTFNGKYTNDGTVYTIANGKVASMIK